MDPEVPVIPKRRKEDRPSGRLRKGLYILPSLFTAANIAMGYYAILQVTHATVAEPWHFDFAAKAIGFAVLFDGLDGRIARMTHTSSDFGRELDSLADVITFGVAPALLAWMWGFRQLPVFLGSSELTGKMIQLGSIASFLFLMAGASRLARFNITVQSATLQPGASRKEIFCGHAHSGGSWSHCCGGALFRRRSDFFAVELHHLDADHRGGGISHGEHVALLQFQGH